MVNVTTAPHVGKPRPTRNALAANLLTVHTNLACAIRPTTGAYPRAQRRGLPWLATATASAIRHGCWASAPPRCCTNAQKSVDPARGASAAAADLETWRYGRDYPSCRCSRSRCDVVGGAAQQSTAVAVACDRSPQGQGGGVRLWAALGRGVCAAHRASGAVWEHTL